MNIRRNVNRYGEHIPAALYIKERNSIIVINKDTFIHDLARKTGCRKYEAENFLHAYKELMRDYLIAGETVRIKNLFKVEVKDCKGRMARNPKTNEPVEMLPYKKIKFTVSEGLKRAVNEEE